MLLQHRKEQLRLESQEAELESLEEELQSLEGELQWSSLPASLPVLSLQVSSQMRRTGLRHRSLLEM